MDVKAETESFNEKVSLGVFSNVQVKLNINIGDVRTDIGSLMSMSAGDILKSQVQLSDKVDLILDGNKVAEGILVEEDGCFSFQVESVS